MRPEEYVEINNFYTATVYEKGAEVIGMLRRLVGPETYARALDLYFERHDGQACTIEDWLAVFEDASGRDLAQFKRWYCPGRHPAAQRRPRPGTARATRSTLAQETPPTPGQPDKAPLVIPVAYGLLDADGATLAEGVLELDRGAPVASSWELPARPVPSLLRGFSAPVILERDDHAGRARLPARPRPRPLQQVGGRPRLRAGAARPPRRPTRRPSVDADYLAAMAAVADDAALDPAFKALALGLPSEDEIIAHIAARRRRARPARGLPRPARARGARSPRALGDRLERLYAGNAVPGPYSPDAAAAGQPRAARPGAGAPDRARPGGRGGARPSSTPPTT